MAWSPSHVLGTFDPTTLSWIVLLSSALVPVAFAVAAPTLSSPSRYNLSVLADHGFLFELLAEVCGLDVTGLEKYCCVSNV